MNVLILLAHNDDEYFAALRIGEELRSGNRVLVAYLTHGSVYGADSERRSEESARALAALGVDRTDMLTIGSREGIFDMTLHRRMAEAYRAVCAALAATRLDRLYVPAWEGGHPDHDATHLVGVAFARDRNLRDEVYEIPFYNRFHAMKFLDDGPDILSTARDRPRALKIFLSARYYRTQRKTFLGLLPASLVRLLGAGRQTYRRVPVNRDYSQPPHAGKLFYEKRFGLSFAEFIAAAEGFVDYGR